MGKEQNQETVEIRGSSMKELFHFVDQYHQFPEKPLLRWIIGVAHLGGMSGFKCCRVRAYLGCWRTHSSLWNNRKWLFVFLREQLAWWTEEKPLTVRAAYSEKRNCPSWMPNETADTLCLPALWDWLYGDGILTLRAWLITQAMVNAMVKEVLFT